MKTDQEIVQELRHKVSMYCADKYFEPEDDAENWLLTTLKGVREKERERIIKKLNVQEKDGQLFIELDDELTKFIETLTPPNN